MNDFYAGFCRKNIDPPHGCPVAGYFVPRSVKGKLDGLEVNAVALRSGADAAVIIVCDLLDIGSTDFADECRGSVSDAAGIPADAVFISCTHTHTGPSTDIERDPEHAGLIAEYRKFLKSRITDAAAEAFDDLSPAKLSSGVSHAPGIAFGRRYLMKDGSVRTNPGVGNPDIVRPLAGADDRISVIRLSRDGKPDIAVGCFGVHPDTIGGEKISADWPGFARRTFEAAVPSSKCVVLNGAEGDINHVNVSPKPGDLNGMILDFDDVSRGYSHARHMGMTVAGGMMQIWEKLPEEEDTRISFAIVRADIPSNMPSPDELPEAERINRLHLAGRDGDLPYTGMMLTTVVAEAARMVALKDGPDAFTMPFSALAVGKNVFIGIPGEPFNAIGKALRDTPGDKMIIPCCLTNGSEGYFPMKDSYAEGGYESRSSRFRAGVGELIIDVCREMISSLSRR